MSDIKKITFKAFIEENNFSFKELEGKVGISSSYLRRLSKDLAKISPQTKEKFEKVFGIELISNIDTKNDTNDTTNFVYDTNDNKTIHATFSGKSVSIAKTTAKPLAKDLEKNTNKIKENETMNNSNNYDEKIKELEDKINAYNANIEKLKTNKHLRSVVSFVANSPDSIFDVPTVANALETIYNAVKPYMKTNSVASVQNNVDNSLKTSNDISLDDDNNFNNNDEIDSHELDDYDDESGYDVEDETSEASVDETQSVGEEYNYDPDALAQGDYLDQYNSQSNDTYNFPTSDDDDDLEEFLEGEEGDM